jgi:hypothetical protein
MQYWDCLMQCKILLPQQPNFSQFFKKNIGITPAEFRRAAHV